MSLRGNRHGLCYTLGSTRDGGGEKIRKEGNNFDFIFPFSSILLFYLFLFCKHKQWRYSLSSALEPTV